MADAVRARLGIHGRAPGGRSRPGQALVYDPGRVVLDCQELKITERRRYPGISDHGLIGDLQTAALVSTDGNVDWFCCPRFDSPSVFASLVDADKGGHFRIAPDRDDFVSRHTPAGGERSCRGPR